MNSASHWGRPAGRGEASDFTPKAPEYSGLPATGIIPQSEDHLLRDLFRGGPHQQQQEVKPTYTAAYRGPARVPRGLLPRAASFFGPRGAVGLYLIDRVSREICPDPNMQERVALVGGGKATATATIGGAVGAHPRAVSRALAQLEDAGTLITWRAQAGHRLALVGLPPLMKNQKNIGDLQSDERRIQTWPSLALYLWLLLTHRPGFEQEAARLKGFLETLAENLSTLQKQELATAKKRWKAHDRD